MIFENKKILVAGSGKSGIAACNLLKKLKSSVVIYDGNENLREDDILDRLEDKKDVKVIIGNLDEKDLYGVCLMVISPGISLDAPFVRTVQKENIPIWSEIELAYRAGKGKVAAITGTNGKTTTTSLTGEIMAGYFEDVRVVGNIGIPYTTTAFDSTEESVTVAEISSFQLETADKFCPDVSAVLNITPDHLDRHKTMDCYAKVKMSITKNQRKDQPVVLNYDDPLIRKYAGDVKNRIVWFSTKEKPDEGAYVDKDNILYTKNGADTFVTKVQDTTLVGLHNTENILAAVAITVNMGVPADVIRKKIKSFKAVPHRIEFVDEIDGVIYYNDSKGTNTDAAIKAIEAMTRPTILIAGGYDKHAEFDDFIEAFRGKIKLMVLIGQTAEKIADTAGKHGFHNIAFADSMEDAVKICKANANKGDAVLLSPACASWDMFVNYEKRGDDFKAFVRDKSCR